MELKNEEKEYQVEVTETISRVITIKAISQDEAWQKVSDMYKNGKIVLDYNDYIDTQIKSV